MARKFKSYRNNYDDNSKKAKIILLIALAVVLALVIAIVAFVLLLSPSGFTSESNNFYVQVVPEKTTYYVGEAPSWYGLRVTLITENGSHVTLGPESCAITGFDSSAPTERQVITVKYKNYATTFSIVILDPNNKAPTGLFTGMTFKTLPKTEYKVGQWLNVDGGVLLLEYDDGTTREIEITYDMVKDFTNSAPGTYTLTVMYMEDGHRATLTYDITVTE